MPERRTPDGQAGALAASALLAASAALVALAGGCEKFEPTGP